MEGHEGASKSTLICATNRRQDLDPALLSRFDLQLNFQLPNQKARRAIFGRYAKQLSDEGKDDFASASDGLSCRDIKEVCEHAERRWVAKLIKKEVTDDTPPLSEYMLCLSHRRREAGAGSETPVDEF